jgi:hypothetical protein
MPRSFRDFLGFGDRPLDAARAHAGSSSPPVGRTSILTLVASLKPGVLGRARAQRARTFASQLARSSRTTTRPTGRSRSRR